MTKLSDVIQRGTNAARPAATAVPIGTLYYDTTNSSLGRSNGTSWESVEGTGGLADQGTATFLDFTTAAAPANPAAGKIRVYSKTGDTLAQRTSGGTETVFGAGGGSSAFTQRVNESGTTITNWTTVSGTWSSDGTVIKCTDIGGAEHRLRYTAKTPNAIMVAETQIQFPTTGQAAAPNYAGVMLGWDGTTGSAGGALIGRIKRDTTSKIELTIAGSGDPFSETVTLALDTWYTFKVVLVGNRIELYLDGTLYGTEAVAANGDVNCLHFGLFAYQSLAWFRNIELWTPTLPT